MESALLIKSTISPPDNEKVLKPTKPQEAIKQFNSSFVKASEVGEGIIPKEESRENHSIFSPPDFNSRTVQYAHCSPASSRSLCHENPDLEFDPHSSGNQLFDRLINLERGLLDKILDIANARNDEKIKRVMESQEEDLHEYQRETLKFDPAEFRILFTPGPWRDVLLESLKIIPQRVDHTYTLSESSPALEALNHLVYFGMNSRREGVDQRIMELEKSSLVETNTEQMTPFQVMKLMKNQAVQNFQSLLQPASVAEQDTIPVVVQQLEGLMDPNGFETAMTVMVVPDKESYLLIANITDSWESDGKHIYVPDLRLRLLPTPSPSLKELQELLPKLRNVIEKLPVEFYAISFSDIDTLYSSKVMARQFEHFTDKKVTKMSSKTLYLSELSNENTLDQSETHLTRRYSSEPESDIPDSPEVEQSQPHQKSPPPTNLTQALSTTL
ncbi:hypothetical protein [Endozoicomonas elysicola]|uniref:Uncharacterized protein n=1 Tax=Endozoicomonas elysicola TaxID=305900 RepID=A0A081KDU9_9GAMM|nr:hypothetical protein [Endozoicomonas elysicola]KEI72325.1 hypothetical protein GV64_17750 [Endozoicomonas elysicola]